MVIYTIVSEMHGRRNITIIKLLLNVEGIIKATVNTSCVVLVMSLVSSTASA